MLSCLRCFPTIILPFTNGKPKRLKLKQTVENATAKIEIFWSTYNMEKFNPALTTAKQLTPTKSCKQCPGLLHLFAPLKTMCNCTAKQCVKIRK